MPFAGAAQHPRCITRQPDGRHPTPHWPLIVDRAIYRDGRRVAEPVDLVAMDEACRDGGGIAWVGLYRPTADEFSAVTREFGLHELAVEDAVNAHFVITVRHSEAPDLARIRHDLESRPDLLQRGPVAILHAIMDRVVDDYAPVVAGIENDIDEIEDDVFDGSAHVSRRIYELAREVILFQRATKPLVAILDELMRGSQADEEEHRYLRDVQDHALRIQEQAAGFRELLQNILSVNLTLETKALSETANAQNEEVKKISAWAAILFAPSMVGTIYGMNFRHMPELDWELGYPFALGLMVLVCFSLYTLFKRRGWI
jgi:magnesium transporter